MKNEDRVFTSNIIRVNSKLKNNLYDVIKIEPAKPLSVNTDKYHTCSFVPKSDKYYVPKKKNGVKVRTVRDIRNMFEKDIISYLPAELEKQKNLLMRKIRAGSSKEEETKEIAKHILKSGSPVTRQVWQMIMNINPLDCKYVSQFVLWNGKYIQLNGSKGGRNKFIRNYDIGKVKGGGVSKPINKRNLIHKRKGLLHNSLNVKFKPGPLTRKKFLDTSNQKYQFGDMELVNLPKPGLNVQPSFGKTIAPTINTFLQNTFLFDADGKISQKWADFAVSVLGTVKNGIPAQLNEDCNITFDLNYKCLQHRLLMRHDSDKTNKNYDISSISSRKTEEEKSTISSQVKNIMNDILNSVEISLNQDYIYFGEDEPRDKIGKDSSKLQIKNSSSRDKLKRKCTELDRLDVTVIRISDSSEPTKTRKCYNSFCALGCVCDSIQCSFNLKSHCGQLECMFNCKCDFSKYNLMDTIDNDCSDIIPGLVNLDKKLGLKLAKEEQKFHQTVIVTDEKSIHLKSRRRNWKTSKKYAEFYSKMHLKTEINGARMLSIECVNLDCKDIEPWCMVHNLYQCFCRGKFTQTFDHNTDDIKVSQNGSDNTSHTTSDDKVIQINDAELESDSLLKVQNQVVCPPVQPITPKTASTLDNYTSDITRVTSNSCARIKSYIGRKYDDLYYKNTNQKIFEMEKNDKKLQNKLMSTISRDDKTKQSVVNQTEQKRISTPDVIISQFNTSANSSSSLDELLSNVVENRVKETPMVTSDKSDCIVISQDKRLPNKSKLVAWLESSYKQYKQTPEQKLVKLSLDAPKNGKVALYSWDFVLSRYREKKNYFLLTKQKPFRIFMAVDIKNPFFETCINVSDIALYDIDKYPVTVRNLLTNVTDLKDNFCILHGLSFCWELVGSVAKVQEKSNKKDADENRDTTSLTSPVEKDSELQNNSVSNICTDNTDVIDVDDSDTDINTIEDFKNQQHEENAELSKWFLMTIENDFTEIRFYNKGFFVKYQNVIKAIDVARVSGKTVRLSSQKYNTAQNDPQFGIYAVPSNENYCVFIGPYEENERLGIETVKNTVSRRKKESTRGIWITTNKVDNINVIDNPLLFLPSHNLELDKMVTLESDSSFNTSNDSDTSIVPNDCEVVSRDDIPVKKTVKPIKIKKNRFYHLSSNSLLKHTYSRIENPTQVPKNLKRIVLNKALLISPNKTESSLSQLQQTKITDEIGIFQDNNRESNKPTASKPIAEIAPQIKECSTPETRKRKSEGGMYVLKPEEINKKSWENTLLFDQSQSSSQDSYTDAAEVMDIEKFIAKSVVRTQNDVFVISDDEDESCASEETPKNIWIVCKSVKNLGWIPGKKNGKKELSFEFPGFKYTEYYPQEEAFKKINQVLSRKVYVPKNINLKWHCVESEDEIKDLNKLTSNDLCPDFVMTKYGLRHKSHLMEKFKTLHGVHPPTSSDEYDSDEVVIKKSRVASDSEDASSALDDDKALVWNEMSKKIEPRSESN